MSELSGAEICALLTIASGKAQPVLSMSDVVLRRLVQAGVIGRMEAHEGGLPYLTDHGTALINAWQSELWPPRKRGDAP